MVLLQGFYWDLLDSLIATRVQTLDLSPRFKGDKDGE